MIQNKPETCTKGGNMIGTAYKHHGSEDAGNPIVFPQPGSTATPRLTYGTMENQKRWSPVNVVGEKGG